MPRPSRITFWVASVFGSALALSACIWVGGLLLDPYAIAPQERPSARVAQMPRDAPGTPSRGRYTPIYARPVAPNLRGVVWVNTRSKIYHYPGYAYFGGTQQGKYEREEEAVAEGNRASLNERRPLDFAPAPSP